MSTWPSTFPSFADPSLRLSTVSSLSRLSWTAPAAMAGIPMPCLKGIQACGSWESTATRAPWMLLLAGLHDMETVPLSGSGVSGSGLACSNLWVWNVQRACC